MARRRQHCGNFRTRRAPLRRAGNESGWSQTIFYFPEQIVREVLRDPEKDVPTTFSFNDPFRHDPKTAGDLKELRHLLDTNVDPLAIEVRLVTLLRRLFVQHGGVEPSKASMAPRALIKARDYLHAHSGKQVRLDSLAVVSGLAKPHRIESFKNYFGLPPHRYLNQIRIEQSRRLLLRGDPIADVAYSVGFADQSHLTRHFRAMLGVTPARYIHRKLAES